MKKYSNTDTVPIQHISTTLIIFSIFQTPEMPLLYSVVARGTTVLARYATCAGNFAEVTEQILSKIPPGESGRLTYSHASYLFHYVAGAGIVFMCITDDVSKAHAQYVVCCH